MCAPDHEHGEDGGDGGDEAGGRHGVWIGPVLVLVISTLEDAQNMVIWDALTLLSCMILEKRFGSRTLLRGEG